ncbi:choloylglycine hydrolase [Bacillus cereus]|uniref:choloylglycine hydrolase family protein n=1 Tax=Bacillus cereus group TaxID=86661 RepID=UPI000BEE7636|nr:MULTISPECIES: choloylglycine hydrolase family protein [Bacillus cereus group]PEA92558.1 choloylglycine hydrolase [Bacillus cereus]PEF48764.1 choloylglycine hydrolase [Bacillus thuringiensis]PFO90830.1 choloylglycine hydrolase [Bacillus cereus]WIK98975.1 choloylglycine hydrolase family protein [Bacillus bombysepticus]
MCTSLTLQTKSGQHLFARTMDFALDFNQEVIIVPRRYQWNNITGETIKAKQAVVGMGINHQGRIILADGVNESGMTCATLYFPGFATYSNSIDDNKTNLAPFDFVAWSLTQFNSVEELKKSVDSISFLDVPLSVLGVTPPLHWILADKWGECIVLEPTIEGLKMYDNPLGVMTNSPEFNWHLQNLRQYIGLKSQPYAPMKWGDLPLSAFGQGSGSMGLPGDFTPPSRFVRAAYSKQNIQGVDNEEEGISAVFHILSNCELPKGGVITEEGIIDNTIYTSAMCMESGIYYYHTYDCRQIIAIHLFNENLDTDEIKTYPFQRKQKIYYQN